MKMTRGLCCSEDVDTSLYGYYDTKVIHYCAVLLSWLQYKPSNTKSVEELSPDITVLWQEAVSLVNLYNTSRSHVCWCVIFTVQGLCQLMKYISMVRPLSFSNPLFKMSRRLVNADFTLRECLRATFFSVSPPKAYFFGHKHYLERANHSLRDIRTYLISNRLNPNAWAWNKLAGFGKSDRRAFFSLFSSFSSLFCHCYFFCFIAVTFPFGNTQFGPPKKLA